jgi:hypothetical protein
MTQSQAEERCKSAGRDMNLPNPVEVRVEGPGTVVTRPGYDQLPSIIRKFRRPSPRAGASSVQLRICPYLTGSFWNLHSCSVVCSPIAACPHIVGPLDPKDAPSIERQPQPRLQKVGSDAFHRVHVAPGDLDQQGIVNVVTRCRLRAVRALLRLLTWHSWFESASGTC